MSILLYDTTVVGEPRVQMYYGDERLVQSQAEQYWDEGVIYFFATIVTDLEGS
jgi:hypothetical protein